MCIILNDARSMILKALVRQDGDGCAIRRVKLWLQLAQILYHGRGWINKLVGAEISSSILHSTVQYRCIDWTVGGRISNAGEFNVVSSSVRDLTHN
jgi:hypothetical protein